MNTRVNCASKLTYIRNRSKELSEFYPFTGFLRKCSDQASVLRQMALQNYCPVKDPARLENGKSTEFTEFCWEQYPAGGRKPSLEQYMVDERAGQAVDAQSPNWPVRCPQCCYIFDGYIHTLSGGTREDVASEGFQSARRPYLTEEYTVVWPWFQWICEQLDCQPEIDAFAS